MPASIVGVADEGVVVGAGGEGVAVGRGASGTRGDTSAPAGAGAAAGFARAGVDGFVECQKQPKDAPAINATLIARKDTTGRTSINRARSETHLVSANKIPYPRSVPWPGRR